MARTYSFYLNYYLIVWGVATRQHSHSTVSVTRNMTLEQEQDGKSVSSLDFEPMTERIAKLEKKIERLNQIHKSEQFIDAIAATVQGLDGKTTILGMHLMQNIFKFKIHNVMGVKMALFLTK